MARTRNILYDEEKKAKDNKIILIFSIILLVIISIMFGYYIYSNRKTSVDDKNLIDNMFLRLTIKSIVDFENLTTNKNHYNNEDISLGYFYKPLKINSNNIDKNFITALTINQMHDCVLKSKSLPSCGIKKSYVDEYDYQVKNDEVLKYAKIIFGNDIVLSNENKETKYGNIKITTFKDNIYYFNAIDNKTNNLINKYMTLNNKIEHLNNESTVNKSVVYVEGNYINNVLIGVKIYKDHTKQQLLKDNKSIYNVKDLNNSVNEYLKLEESPKYKFTYKKNNDGSFYFYSSELLN